MFFTILTILKTFIVFNTEKRNVRLDEKYKRAKKVTEILNNIKTVREFAKKIGEFKKYLKEIFSTETSGKGLDLFYHNQYYGGNHFSI